MLGCIDAVRVVLPDAPHQIFRMSDVKPASGDTAQDVGEKHHNNKMVGLD